MRAAPAAGFFFRQKCIARVACVDCLLIFWLNLLIVLSRASVLPHKFP